MLDSQSTQVCKNTAVSSWLNERNEMLVLYCKLSGYRNETKLPENKQINTFCDILIDYVSAGHFEVYQEIVNSCENNGPSSVSLLNELYPKISKTTDVVVNFNEKYSKMLVGDNDSLTSFDSDLSLLGEAIASRVDLEDHLIDTLNDKY